MLLKVFWIEKLYIDAVNLSGAEHKECKTERLTGWWEDSVRSMWRRVLHDVHSDKIQLLKRTGAAVFPVFSSLKLSTWIWPFRSELYYEWYLWDTNCPVEYDQCFPLFYYHGIAGENLEGCIRDFQLLEVWCKGSISGWQHCTNKHRYGTALKPTKCKDCVSAVWVRLLWKWFTGAMYALAPQLVCHSICTWLNQLHLNNDENWNSLRDFIFENVMRWDSCAWSSRTKPRKSKWKLFVLYTTLQCVCSSRSVWAHVAHSSKVTGLRSDGTKESVPCPMSHVLQLT